MPDVHIYRTIPDQVEARLRTDILSGALVPGQALREKEVSERFGVSRGPIREAFRQLTQQGLLVREANKGVHVAHQPSSSVRPLIVELRRSIETFALSNIFEQITAENIFEWEAILADIKEACQKGDASALVNHDLRFHRSILLSYQDEDILALWQPIVLRMLIQYNRLGGDLMQSYYEHKRILNAIRAGNIEAALAALAENIQ